MSWCIFFSYQSIFLETVILILFCFSINFCIVLKFGSLTLTLTKTPNRRPFVGVSLVGKITSSTHHLHTLACSKRDNFQNCISSAQIRERSLSDYCVLLKDVGFNSKIELEHHVLWDFEQFTAWKKMGPDNVEIQLFSNQIYF